MKCYTEEITVHGCHLPLINLRYSLHFDFYSSSVFGWRGEERGLKRRGYGLLN